MAEDQSVVGRRRIYYDAHGSEALICSDSEEEIAEPEEEKHVFSKGEDRIIWCFKSCKNCFRRWHCAKSQCKSRQCPCFAAGRECDPDVCGNCWVSHPSEEMANAEI